MRTITLLAILAAFCLITPGCQAEFDYELDADGDGAADWIEVVAGTDREDATSVPDDADGNGVFDVLQGPRGPMGEIGFMGDPGPTGDRGPTGPTGLGGIDGLNCWDLDADGVQDLAEDINGDTIWNALDCQGAAGSGITKADLYAVLGIPSSGLASAACADANDVLLSGGCDAVASGALQASFPNPTAAVDPTVVASWSCIPSVEGLTVPYALCLTVP